ncbi:DUF4167 domain-containing protein [Sphingomonas sp. AX6]|uniref:DUF4167 domain-containing protein n=1 Tax=Sphingomonas sp. AX6 TaxID=2653171 RepID=UPI0012F25DD1|nr:DUF4167 domain-containing protein [Sphingomonas sp. AX6]VXC71654.1 conserved hypothetical protein [Sphingomonas sp. AX6]
MINNRQAGRRRGRGGQRPQGGGGNAGRGGGDSGNRIDSRARGNAPQLLEKYKNLARDAQMAGDRVNTEYYLQFADHYFRVLSDNRARQEEQNGTQGQPRRGRDDFTNAGDDDDGEDYNTDISNMDDDDRGQQRDARGDRDGNRDRQDRDDRGNGRERGERNDRNDRDVRGDRNDRPQRTERPERNDRPERSERAERPERNERNDRPEREARRPRREEGDSQPRDAAPVQTEAVAEEAPAPARRRGRPPRAKVEESSDAGFDAAILPPALSVSASDSAAAESEEERPRRRRRVTRDEGDVSADAA